MNINWPERLSPIGEPSQQPVGFDSVVCVYTLGRRRSEQSLSQPEWLMIDQHNFLPSWVEKNRVDGVVRADAFVLRLLIQSFMTGERIGEREVVNN